MPRRKDNAVIASLRTFKHFLKRISKSQSAAEIRETFMKAYKVEDLPVRIRPAFIAATIVTLLLLSVLGFHPTLAGKITPPVPLWDKLLHLVGFFLATLFFYAIWDVDDDARKYFWLWRYWSEILCVAVCIGAGSIGSEFVQGMLPYKTFQWGDIVANVVGSVGGIFAGNRWMSHLRTSREMRNLYQSLSLAENGNASEESLELPVQRSDNDTWDAQDPVFSLGDDEE